MRKNNTIELVANFGIIILLVLSFLGPSPIPTPADAVALGLVVTGTSPQLVLATLVLGHILGLFFFYHLGFSSGKMIEHWEAKKHLRHYKIAYRLYKKFGKYSLLFCNVPFLGKPLVVVAGTFRLQTRTFAFWYLLGKILWYGLILILILQR